MAFTSEGYPFVQNTMYNTKPAMLHGNGPSKRTLNTLANYVPKAWNTDDQCTACWEETVSFVDLETPLVVVAIFIGTMNIPVIYRLHT